MKNVAMNARVAAVAACAMLLVSTVAGHAAGAKAVEPTGDNAVNGGFGFQGGLSDAAPGGFKWFNEYNRGLSDLIWLNVQFNVSLGNNYTRSCWYNCCPKRR